MYPNSGRRRRHSEAKVLAACDEPGASISGVALAHGLNTNLVRKWRSGRGIKRSVMAIASTAAIRASPAARGAAPEFVAVDIPAPLRAAARAAVQPMAAPPISESLIQIELRRGALHLNARWPTTATEDCRAWLSELSSGLLK
jgi:transposase